MQNDPADSRLVYSTSCGKTCPQCAQALERCSCAADRRRKLPQNDGIACLRYELSGRKGKGATLISGLALDQDELLELAAKLKRKFATGGSVKDYVIALQGDWRAQGSQELRKMGYPVK